MTVALKKNIPNTHVIDERYAGSSSQESANTSSVQIKWPIR